MAPKAVQAGATESSADMLVLINLIRTATEFKADMNEMAKIYKIAQTKNVPRKINGVLVPHGYKFINGKVEHDGVAKDHDQSENVEKAPLKTPTKTTKKAPKTPKSKEPKTPKLNKKRKLEEEEDEAENDDDGMVEGEDDEAVELGVKADDGVKEGSR